MADFNAGAEFELGRMHEQPDGTWNAILRDGPDGDKHAFVGIPATQTNLIQEFCRVHGLVAKRYVRTGSGYRIIAAPLLTSLTTADPSTCPDCKGTGEYCGLMLIENCRACGGTGKA